MGGRLAVMLNTLTSYNIEITIIIKKYSLCKRICVCVC